MRDVGWWAKRVRKCGQHPVRVLVIIDILQEEDLVVRKNLGS